MRIRLVLLFSLLACTAAAQQPDYTITPNRGPVAGGTEIRITSREDLGTWPYGVIFGETHVPAVLHDSHTLVATTPAHLPGTVPVNIFQYDIGIATGLTFTFEGEAEDAFDRLLLPVYVPPIRGAFGSEFRTELRMALNRSETRLPVYGLLPDGSPYELHTDTREIQGIEPSGKPGRFIYVPKGTAKDLVMNLRAFDVSRARENFGTQIPIVPASEFATNGHESQIGIVGVPTSPRFRSKLRIYGTPEWGAVLNVDIETFNQWERRQVTLNPTDNPYEPSYAEISDLPEAGIINIWISVHTPPISALLPAPDIWAFVSVTNNETQHITTITPR
ncbi:MAG TPA: IPT/TIG domain-containing protein [Thermoanaerobaculia bacterium]|nr:IPT/TIG domain-containing protein [Thermoanaerobaculia bacterium]